MYNTVNALQSAEDVKIILNDLTLTADLIQSLFGKKIGEGSQRNVYEYNLYPEKYVIKYEKEGSVSNTTEYLLWNEVQNLTGKLAWVKKWFAPILWISPDKRILVMEKTFKKDRKPPKEVPAFFFDAHEGNFGWIGNRFVCHDYGIIYGFRHYGKKMQKLDWTK